jgi:hypothetical protein
MTSAGPNNGHTRGLFDAPVAGWFKLSNAAADQAADVGPVALTVYVLLARHVDQDGTCWPSMARLARLAGVVERSVRRAIRALEAAGWIRSEHRRSDCGDPDTNLYRLLTISPVRVRTQTTPGTDTNDSRVGTETTPGVRTETTGGTDTSVRLTRPKNKTKGNQTQGTSPKLRFSDADRLTAGWMFSLIQQIDAKSKKPNLERWANEIRLTREIDNRTDQEIRRVFWWANQNTFWRGNILSPAKLREKFTQLLAQSQRNGAHDAPPSGPPKSEPYIASAAD